MAAQPRRRRTQRGWFRVDMSLGQVAQLLPLLAILGLLFSWGGKWQQTQDAIAHEVELRQTLFAQEVKDIAQLREEIGQLRDLVIPQRK
jgi:hypothetical protein